MNTGADDIWYWQTVLMVDDAEALYNKLKSANYSFVSKELSHPTVNGVHYKSFIVKDPDGHAMFIEEILK